MEQHREVIQRFADRMICRAEVEERTGLYLSEILIEMGKLGIQRKHPDVYEGMSEQQRELFDKVFSADVDMINK